MPDVRPAVPARRTMEAMVIARNSDGEIPGEEPGVGNTPLLVSLMPFALFVLLYFVLPGAGERVFRDAPGGMPVVVKLVAVFFALAWGGLGTILVSEASSYGRAILALLACTLPSSFFIAIAPGS